MSKDRDMKVITKKYMEGKLEPRKDLPEDLKIAIESFIKQAAIVEEYNLDYMNPEYLIKLIESFSKYPEHSLFTWKLFKPLLEKIK
jgi:hypothetical protein